MTDYQDKNQRTIVGSTWLSRTLPKVMGVSYELCSPIIAGQASLTRQDIVGREIDLSKRPVDTVFFNLEPDFNAVKDRKHWELDYISGNSDPSNDDTNRLLNGCLAYWEPLSADDKLDYDDAIIVRMSHILTEAKINSDWLCLRRVGGNKKTIFDNNEKLAVRTRVGDRVEQQYIDRKSVVGRIFGRAKIDPKSRVRMAETLPFGNEVYSRPSFA